MIELYAAPTSNGLRAKIMLDECGLDYTLHRVDLRAREHKTPDFLKMNPFGLTPVMIDADGPGGQPITMAQSAAILLYLAEKTGKFFPADPAARAPLLAPLMSVISDVGPSHGALNHANRMDPPDPAAKAFFAERYKRHLVVWDAHFANHEWCGGGDVSIIDFAMFGVQARTDTNYPECVEGLSNLARWFAAMKARPGVRKGMDFG
jgi:GST-like protein